jgi:NAD(P)-dependent dehydrogenase (short-subunit alcohol dehydrogenase family)
MRRGEGRRLIINIAPAGGLSHSSMFPYASSRAGFQGLSDALADQTRGSMIGVVGVAPDLRQQLSAMDAPHYRNEKIDEEATAARVLDLVTAIRPEWRQRDARRIRRA